MFDGDIVPQVLGVPLIRKEDPGLLTGRGRYGDDLPVPQGTLHAHVVRSPHAHARILNVNAAAALTMPGVAAVISGEAPVMLPDGMGAWAIGDRGVVASRTGAAR